jgi:hypothetical protein
MVGAADRHYRTNRPGRAQLGRKVHLGPETIMIEFHHVKVNFAPLMNLRLADNNRSTQS